jgi:hypothetical protein
VELDSRPSDAVNLALRSGAPVYVAAHLLMHPEGVQRFLERFGTRFEGSGPRFEGSGTWPNATPPAY